MVGSEGGVVVGLGKARPIKEVRKLSRGICRRTQSERGLNSVEHIPDSLVGYIPSKPAGHAGGTTARRAEAASRQSRFEERLRRCHAPGQRIESLRKALPSSHHKKRHLVQVNAFVDVPGGVADIADLYTAASRQLALNGEIPLVMRTRLPLRIFHLGTGNKGDVAAGHKGVAGPSNCRRRDGRR